MPCVSVAVWRGAAGGAVSAGESFDPEGDPKALVRGPQGRAPAADHSPARTTRKPPEKSVNEETFLLRSAERQRAKKSGNDQEPPWTVPDTSALSTAFEANRCRRGFVY